MEFVLQNCIVGLVHAQNTTIFSIASLLENENYRGSIAEQIKDPVVKKFWSKDYNEWSKKFETEAVLPIQQKIQVMRNIPILRSIFEKQETPFTIRQIMDKGGIFLANLSKGTIGEDLSKLLGIFLITQIEFVALERTRIIESERNDFYLYIDEFRILLLPHSQACSRRQENTGLI